MLDIDALLRTLAANKGSDLHLKVGVPPTIRVDGVLKRLEGERLSPTDTAEIAEKIMPGDRAQAVGQIDEADFAYSVPGVARFRVNAFRQRWSISMVFRLVRMGSASFDDLGPSSGGQGAGRCATRLDLGDRADGLGQDDHARRDDRPHQHVEAGPHPHHRGPPIEVLHPDREATVNQREVGVDTANFLTAMRAAMREDPDVILIG
jgi:twitching motility protein PilT